ncbi:MAG: DUF479 domain-containing protein [Saprospirales bacterium]|nr:MAG: DUF479 domain-containing protein [Saprospirales bacterium]
MNYLGHAIFSPENRGHLLGNLAGDFLKNNFHRKLDAEVLHGVHLHRFIDSATDSNPIFRKFTIPLREKFGKYSPVVMDVLLDHLIAKNWNNLFDKRFDEFTSEVSKVIMSEFERLPMPVGGIMQRMATADWLKSGETETGIIKVYKRLSEKASTALEGSEVLKIYHKNTEFYDELLIDFVKMNRDLVMNNYPGINLRIEWKN